jgi:hypothetical protein
MYLYVYTYNNRKKDRERKKNIEKRNTTPFSSNLGGGERRKAGIINDN